MHLGNWTILIHRASQTPFEVFEGMDLQESAIEEGLYLANDYVYWRTCQRQILFLRPDFYRRHKSKFKRNDQVFSGIAVTDFLLRLSCGLLSKIKGETEIMGQFKRFLSVLKNQGSWLYHPKEFEKILAELKKIRQLFLTDLGSQSYGSVVRKWVSDHQAIAVVGAGLLAKDIVPWLAEKQIKVFSRNPAKAKVKLPADNSVKTIDQIEKSECLIIAAPIKNALAIKLVMDSTATRVIDLRGLTQKQDSEFAEAMAGLNIKLQNLKQLFECLDSDKPELIKKIKLAQDSIDVFLQNLELAMHIRPLGWEDVCA
jgi:glutamyl-tRNA reductase